MKNDDELVSDAGSDERGRAPNRSNKGERFVEIPEACKIAKPRFKDEPSPQIVKEIRDFVAETGASHLWPWHTHTRPPDNATVKYIGKFELPEKFQRAKQFLVCPICNPSSRKFGKREGMIAWFPNEYAVRLIGPDCFKKINKEGHDEAVRELKAREKRNAEVEFLVSRRDQHRLALKVLIEARRVANAIDAFGGDLRRTLAERLGVDLWRHVRTGELQVAERFREARPNPNDPGNPIFVDSERSVRYGSLDGYKLLDPNAKNIASKFHAPITSLERALAISDEDWKGEVDRLDDDARRVLVKRLGDALNAARELSGQVVGLRTFMAAANLGTLRRWGSTEGRPLEVYARREGSTIRIGNSENRCMSVRIPADLEREIPSVAGLTASRPK
jgi:hypothetical protein